MTDPRAQTAARLLAAALAVLTAGAAHAGAADPDTATDPVPRGATYEFTVTERRPVTASSTLTVPAEDFALRPLESGGQMLEAVPNVLTAQHTGGGKAEQYFLRGFDADHGTDLRVLFDGVPVNLRSHAHGQGFIDLHFVTPETVQRIDAYKGPYFARFGDFATAATIDYVPYGGLPESFVQGGFGEFDTQRTVAVLSPRFGPFAGPEPRAEGFVSFEAYHTDGPFENDERLWRYSGLARGSVELAPGVRLSGHALGYSGDWDASGLLPEELVEAGTLGRFGSLDPTEGGSSQRFQGKLQVDWSPDERSRLTAYGYVAHYELELFSNFTFFLNDPVNGDGIVQKDRRLYGGGRLEYVRALDLLRPALVRLGVETRHDAARVRLGRQRRRDLLGFTNDDFVRETSVGPYVELEVLPCDWVRLVSGLRFEWLFADVDDRLGGNPEGSLDDGIWLPKASLVLRPFGPGGPWESERGPLRDLELFGNFGMGFHSNDVRGAVADRSEDPLVRATGAEVGLRTRLLGGRIDVALDAFWLELDSELAFVGDEGTTEPGPRTVRKGVELATRAHLTEWLYARGDVAYTSARDAEADRPLSQAPRFVAKAAVGVRYAGLAAELGVRSFGDRHASDDDPGPKLSGYTVLDLGLRYRWGPVELGLTFENLTDERWRSSEFFFESRPMPAGPAREDFHFTPGNPRNVRGWIRASF